MRQYYSDYATQDAFEFYAQDEWNHREDPSEDDDYEDWVEMHFDEIEDVMNEAKQEQEDYIHELLEDDPDWYDTWDPS